MIQEVVSGDDLTSVVEEYQRTGSIEIRNRLLEKFLWIAKTQAIILKKGMLKEFDLRDLVSYGVFGLFKALDDFDGSRGSNFIAYANAKVRWAIIDQVREEDWVPRIVRIRAGQYSTTLSRVGRAPTVEELSSILDVPIEEAQRITENRVVQMCFCRMEDSNSENPIDKDRFNLACFADSKAPNPEDGVDGNSGFWDLISHLDRKEKVVMTLYFLHGLSVTEIAEIIGKSKSLVSAIRLQAVESVRQHLAWNGMLEAYR